MTKNLMSLSFSVEANKGVYALLLGSGISYSSGIPTGWGILKELCRRIMIHNGESETDEIKWYESYYGKPALYDEVIEMLAKTSSERSGLLREFFEPTEDDLEHKRKTPTQAHRSIAQLVKQGYIKVIITTNFDRLIEQSLDELNVQYQTLYHDSDIEGMKPLAHADCTVLKIHGDYRDTRFKNVTDELKSYSEPLMDILKRIFDEYGLIVSGWSAEWDTALRDVIKSVKGRRYSWYWHSLSSEINDKADELIRFRDANIIVDGGGADHFFKSLKENIEGIAEGKKTNIDNLEVKINRLKKYLSNNDDIEIRDTLTEETKKVINIIQGMNANVSVDINLVRQWVEKIKQVMTPISVLTSIVAFYKGERYEQLLIETLERLTTLVEHSRTEVLLKLKELPIQGVFYSVGISLVKAENYKTLNSIFVKPKVRNRALNMFDFLYFMSPYRGLDEVGQLLSKSKMLLPFESNIMQPFMESIFIQNQLCISKEEIIINYDIFEFLRATKHRYLGDNDYFSGCFGLKYNKTDLEKFISDSTSIENWNGLILFGHNKNKFYDALEKLRNDLDNASGFSGRSLLNSISIKKSLEDSAPKPKRKLMLE